MTKTTNFYLRLNFHLKEKMLYLKNRNIYICVCICVQISRRNIMSFKYLSIKIMNAVLYPGQPNIPSIANREIYSENNRINILS